MADALKTLGMAPAHFEAFKQVASQLTRIIVVRNTNEKLTPWIIKGYPPKPMSIKCHTSKTTGKVTAVNQNEINTCRMAGFYVIDQDGIARGRTPKDVLQVKFPFNTPEMNEPGQVIDGFKKKALVGDYDLLAVIDPSAPGRNITLAASDGRIVDNRMSPDVQRVMQAVNAMLDMPRVMHGAHDQFAGFPDSGGSTAFFPNKDVTPLLTPDDVRSFYASIGRQTIAGKY